MPIILHEIPKEYDKLYQEFLDIVTELHNAHISFKHRPVKTAAQRVRKAVFKLQKFIPPYKNLVIRWTREYNIELRKAWKDSIQKKKEDAKIRKQRPPKRKKNDNNSSTKTTI